MLHPAIPASLFALAAPAVASIGDQAVATMRTVQARSSGRTVLAQVTIHERIIIRVPRMGPASSVARIAPAPPVRYKEKKGPKCVAVAELGGAQIVGPGTVDLVMSGGKRLRARLDRDCGPLDFYNGFYLRPAADGMVCAARDVIRMRSGASCAISTFKTLRPER